MRRLSGSHAILAGLFRAALAGSDAGHAVSRALRAPEVARALAGARRLAIFAVGKAAGPMLLAAPDADAVLAVLPEGARSPGRRGAEVLFAPHPRPDRRSTQAARRALEFFEGYGRQDVILCLVSGGTSSLLALPRRGWTLARKRAAVQRLMDAGASIVELNRLRKRLSGVKGGRLGRATRARLVTLVLSDVPGDDPAIVGSGPTIRRRRGDVTLVVGSNRTGLSAAALEARRLGLAPRIQRNRSSGEASRTGRRLARAAQALGPGQVLLAGGETTVTLEGRRGRGGRCLELALGAAQVLDGSPGLTLLAAASDGVDGSSRAAGAFADGRTVVRAAALGLSPHRTLARHDSERFFDRLGDLFVTGLTGTNVNDWIFALRERKP